MKYVVSPDEIYMSDVIIARNKAPHNCNEVKPQLGSMFDR